jgi:hypothetical protein
MKVSEVSKKKKFTAPRKSLHATLAPKNPLTIIILFTERKFKAE